MAVELDIKTTADFKGLTTQLDKVIERLEGVEKDMKGVSKQTEEIGESAKTSAKGTNTLARGFKGVGLAIKAAGIGILLSVLGTLQDLFMSNQKVVDTFSTAFDTLGIIFNDVFNAVSRGVSSVNEATSGFEALGKVMSALLTLSVTPLKLAFFGIKLAIQEAMLAWEKSFFGDEDPKTIKNLNAAIAETRQDLVDTGKDAINAGVDIKENFVDAVSEIGKAGEAVINEVSKVEISTSLERAKSLNEAEKNARLAAAQQQLLIEKYDIQAERLRQLRDDDTKSTAERIEANEKLGEVLDEQGRILKETAQAQLDAAEQRLAVDRNNIEAQIALIDAKSNLLAVEAQVTGFQSEQLVNRNALEREAAEARKKDEEEFTALFKAAEDERLKAAEEANKKQIQLEESKEKAKGSLIQKGFEFAQEVLGGNTEAAKGAAAAQATFDTYAAITAQLKTAAGSGAAAIPGYAIGQAIATGAFGFLQVQKILSTPTSGGGSASISGSSGAGSVPQPEEQDEFQTPDVGFFNQGVGGTQNADFGANKSYVVLQDIRNNQSLDERIRDSSRLG